ncbi:MAG: UbiD family decarboxylase [Nitrososphaerota archaeon]|nr:UbiD family decarboxylase [Nitrososphaerota archaeon]MDG6930264.1 UbiD family decarboxylase [Nitrososphaerota archaeon]MDG6932612.1 UbiD family decarboxylase [Nitrososphaerota archaeon]MDG6935596.1 UbiD family decarboxylase [Nitrososphaerota archaeon]MDG6944040.1 UbiD family decarboxylase [Nitrososphaerota archaeon]
MSLREFLNVLASNKLLADLGEASVDYQIAGLEESTNNSIMVSARETGTRVVSNLVNSRKKVSLVFGCAVEDVHSRFIEAAGSPARLSAKEFSGYLAVKSLGEIPVVRHFEKDLGPYITSSIVIAKNPADQMLNASVHRIRVTGGSTGVIRMVEGRHLHSFYAASRQLSQDLPVAVAIGVHPAVEFSAAYQAPYGAFELEIANSILGGKLNVMKSPKYGLPVPDAEYIIEGKISIKDSEMDMMTEMLGNYDFTRRQPVLNVEQVYSRENPIFWDILPGGTEHRWLMGFPVEAKMNKALRDTVPSTRRVVLTEGGSKWLHAVVQISKKLEGEPVNAIIAAFAAHPSLKMVTVVDDDIDPENAEEVEFAVATRFQASRGLLVIHNAKGSSLDPSSDQSRLLTDKVGIDATMPLEGREKYARARIPGVRK